MRLAIISKSPIVQEGELRSTLDLFIDTGCNTGNLCFIEAVDRQVRDEKVYYDWDFQPDIVNERHDAALLVCANMINPDLDLTDLTERLSRLHLPLSAVSIGVQGPLHGGKLLVHSSIRNFLDVLSSGSVSFGVRGRRAAEFLDGVGIRNFRLIGCPSNFLNPDFALGRKVLDSISAPRRVAAHLDVLQHNNVQASRHLRSLCAMAETKFFVQSPWSYIFLSRLSATTVLEQSEAAMLRDVFGWDGLTPAWTFARDHLAAYFNVSRWADALATFDLSLGFRLHGNILALQAGRPAIIVTHDERTRELAETLCLPQRTVAQFFLTSTISELMDNALPMLSNYDLSRRHLASEYTALLSENGMTYDSALDRLAHERADKEFLPAYPTVSITRSPGNL